MFASKNQLFTRPSNYLITRSVRLRSSASANFSRTPSVAGNRKTWTWSAWVKRGTLNTNGNLFGGAFSTASDRLLFEGSDRLWFIWNDTTDGELLTTQVFRDTSAWYHIVCASDTTQATASNRMKFYVNGVQITTFTTATYPTQNRDGGVNNTTVQKMGVVPHANSQYLDGYLTEINFIDGQALTPSSFGETDSITGVWKPKKYAGTYGTNGFYLNFSDNSNNTATTIGKDYSGNGNNWTPNNISVTSGSTYDSMTDVPTLTSATAGNYCVMNPLNLPKGGTLSNGNLLWTSPTAEGQAVGTMYVSSGKFYWEMVQNSSGGCAFGIASITTDINNINLTAGSYVYYTNGNKYNGGTGSAYGATFTNGDIIGVALDLDAGTLIFYKNNTSQGTAFTGLSGTFTALIYDGTSASAPTYNANFGQQPFTYTPPTGYVALNTYNLPTSTITNGAAYMAATTYTGTGSSLTIANTVGSTSFQPDFVWVKSRSAATDHALYDSVRGTTKDLVSNSTAAETTQSTGLTAFNSTGFTVGALAKMNTSSATYVAWQWYTNGGTSSSNTNGSITSTVSAGATQGFSVVTYTGTGANATVGHGLGVAPSMIILKQRNAVDYWVVWQTTLGSTGYLLLNSTNGSSTAATYWNSTLPTSSVFSLGSDSRPNGSGTTYVAYCFAAVKGFSAFGSYTGNGSTDGPFVYTGFRPRWLLYKRYDSTADWVIVDSSRSTYNLVTNVLYPDLSNAEDTSATVDFLSNGFKFRGTAGNNSGASYIYACFAENPFKNALAR
jgi:hypothetical protein